MPSTFRENLETIKRVILSEFNPQLSGNFAPVQDELFVRDLPIIGDIPRDLTGIYMRNGPNPQFATLLYAWPFDGDGMVHAIYIADGKAHYRNRYVETKSLLKERRAGKPLYGSLLRPTPLDPERADPDETVLAVKVSAHIHII